MVYPHKCIRGFSMTMRYINQHYLSIYLSIYKWPPISCRLSAGQGKFAEQRPTFYHCATQQAWQTPSSLTEFILLTQLHSHLNSFITTWHVTNLLIFLLQILTVIENYAIYQLWYWPISNGLSNMYFKETASTAPQDIFRSTVEQNSQEIFEDLA